MKLRIGVNQSQFSLYMHCTFRVKYCIILYYCILLLLLSLVFLALYHTTLFTKNGKIGNIKGRFLKKSCGNAKLERRRRESIEAPSGVGCEIFSTFDLK